MTHSKRYRVVQPYGRDVAKESTLISEHSTIAEAFSYIDTQAEQMARTGAPTDAVGLLVVDRDGQQIPRPGAH